MTILSDNLNEPTSIYGFAKAVAHAVASYGEDPDICFARHGIRLNQGQNSAITRFPVRAMQHIWQDAAERSNDKLFGRRVARYLGPSSFHYLGFGLANSSSPSDLFRRLVKYKEVISHCYELNVAYDTDHVTLRISDGRQVATSATAHAFFFFLISLGGELFGPGFKPRKLYINTADLPAAPALSEAMDCGYEISKGGIAIAFDRELIENCGRGVDHSLSSYLDLKTEDYLSDLKNRNRMRMRAKLKIIERLSEEKLSLDTVAAALNMSNRSLQRYLKEEGTTFQELTSQTRRQLAERYARDMKFSATEIAFTLGFSDAASFSRAFRDWTGMTFRDYRKSLPIEDEADRSIRRN